MSYSVLLSSFVYKVKLLVLYKYVVHSCGRGSCMVYKQSVIIIIQNNNGKS